MLDESKRQLLAVAKSSVFSGLRHGAALTVDPASYCIALQKAGASFVTLKLDGQLRGCIGSLLAYRPLVEDVSENAFSAAFRDSRFPALNQSEYDDLHYHISVLSEAEPMHVESEDNLLQQLVPFQDGLILSEGSRSATFLPAVWEQLPSKREFLNHLKAKAGLSPGYWSEAIQVERYSVESFSEDDLF